MRDVLTNLDEFMSEHLEAKARAEAEAQAEKDRKYAEQQAKWDADRAAARKIKLAKERSFYETLARWMRMMRPTTADRVSVVTLDENNELKVRFGNHVVQASRALETWNWSMVRVNTGGSWSSRSRFPQKKNGSYSWERMAIDVWAWVDRQIADAKTDAVRDANKDEATALRHKLRIKSYSSNPDIEVSATVGKPVKVKVSINHSMTSEQAERVINFLKDEGLLNEWAFAKEGEELKD